MSLRVGVLTILFVFSLATMALSQSTNEEERKERSEYETGLRSLQRNNPKKYENNRKIATLWTQLLLGRLGYGIGPYDGLLDKETKNALKAYQEQRNLPITGDPLSFETFEQISKDTDSLDYKPANLPSLFISLDSWESGYVSGKGTWVLSNEKTGWPEQTTHIQCLRNQSICIEATAVIMGKGGDKSLRVDTEMYEIERWDAHEIVTKPKETSSGCVRYVRRFNKVQKSVTGLRSTISTGEFCKGVEVKEMYMILSDGFKVYWELSKAYKKTLRELMRFSPGVIKSTEQKPDK